jgi:hypothetical protein
MASGTPRRVDFKDGIPVALRSFLISSKGRILNLSMTGAYVETPMHLLPQARVRLSIVLDDAKHPLEADAVVVWEDGGGRGGPPNGYGLRFIDLGGETRKAIAALIRGGETPPSPPAAKPVSPDSEDKREGPPYPLRADEIRRRVPEAALGVYVLSYERSQKTRVGRADFDLRKTLSAFEGEYDSFYFELIEADEERYHRECEIYHRLGGDRGQLENSFHPDRPDWLPSSDCPVCIAAKPR